MNRQIKRKILDVIAWVALAVGVVMIIWKIFGNSPSIAEVLAPFVVLALVKVWKNSEGVMGVGHGLEILSVNTKSAFDKIREDTGRIENKIDELNFGEKKK